MLENLIEEESLDPRVIRTRRLLVTAFQELLGEQPFHKITISDLAERATLNRATFYAHFTDKYDLLSYVVRQDFQEQLDDSLSGDADLDYDHLRQLILITADFVRTVGGHCVPTVVDHDVTAFIMIQLQETLYDTLARWAGRVTRSTEETEALAIVSSSAILGSVMRWQATKQPRTAEELADLVLPQLTAGIGQYLTDSEAA